MLVAFGENDIKTVEDLAGCATDDLVGWTEGRGPEAVRHKGALDGFELSRTDAEAMIMAARVKAGWIEARWKPRARGGRDGSAADADRRRMVVANGEWRPGLGTELQPHACRHRHRYHPLTRTNPSAPAS
jgi:N utilization substance protein A